MSFSFVSFDLETTGITPGIDRIVEIGAVRFTDYRPVEKFTSLINPLIPISEEVSKINGITDQMLEGKPTIDKVLDSFTEFCKKDPLVAHNAPFDYQFLLEDIKKHESSAPEGTVLDTYLLSKKIFQGLPNYKLESLIKWLKIPHSDQFHRAEQDALCCGQLFTHILKQVFKNGKIELENLINLTGKAKLVFPKMKKSHKQMSFF